jgi:predicted transcriptional regulator of viral defense system
MKKNENRGDQLYALAETQGGYFTAADAKDLGYAYPHQHFHVKRGNWIRVDRGIFRLKRFPVSPHEDLIHWWLWSRKQGAISHESAAAIYDIGDVLPRTTHLTVPKSFRKVAPRTVMLHKAQLHPTDIERREGFAVTTPLRTILDLMQGQLDPERLSLVTKDALQKGLVTRKEILHVLAEMPEKIDPATQVTLQLAVREDR